MNPDDRPALSFELYPPRSRMSRQALETTIAEIEPTRPDYVSVTAAVDGERRRQSLDLLRHLVEETELKPLAHIVSTGQIASELEELVDEIIRLGVRGLLALRGDRPENYALKQGELPFARHLVELIRGVESRGSAKLCAGRLAVGVAAYPVRHPESSSIHHDTEVLLAKQRAGADFAITQVYPDPSDYARLAERARANAVELPLIPGILPVTSLRRYLRVCGLAGIEPNAGLAHRLETAETFAERLAVGVDSAEDFARQALAAGAPGLHIYTFNEHQAALELVDRLGLRGNTAPANQPISPLNDQEIIVTNPNNVLHSTSPKDRAFPPATILGYPRIGPNREVKRALEAYWSGQGDIEDLSSSVTGIRHLTVGRLRELGLKASSSIPASFALYDQVLDAILATGAVPTRFADLANRDHHLNRDASFVLARGDDARGPLEMTKWFNTNYHYLVPEIGPRTPFTANPQEIVGQLQAGAFSPNDDAPLRPAILGPISFLLLSKAEDTAPVGFEPLNRIEELVEVYRELISALGNAGAEWVQLEEPALVAENQNPELAEIVRRTYERLSADRAAGDPLVLVTTAYGDAENLLEPLVAAGVDAVHVDLVSGPANGQIRRLDPDQLSLFTGTEAPVLVAGIVNGQNIWRTDLRTALARLEELHEAGANVAVSTSTSLIHVPHDAALEDQLGDEPRTWLAFADQKVEEVCILARGLADGPEAIANFLDESDGAIRHRTEARGTRDALIRERADLLTESDGHREPAEERRREQALQGISASLPELPTTTIGSFPQTPEIRAVRADHRAGRISDSEYTERLREEIRAVVALQEEIGLDVLVHGEPERNDMVQYFAENLDGFDVTRYGWVQSYGSRCTRPSILWGDVSRQGEGVRGRAITVPWITYAQSLTDRPVKGMLTGPVTILAWSFVREDQPLADTANQVALALRDEVNDLEAAGIGVVQVDEPALRELLPLRERDRAEYLEWSVRAFRLATSGVRPETQIHTHLCYSEFGEVLSAIDALDADVTSVEAARSRMELLDPLADIGFERGIGPGVWDIHSPRVPTVTETEDLLSAAARVIPRDRLWANPDCGLKTRQYEETTAALKRLVEAARRVRAGVTV
ncbi:5-methyltetrahydropteroyltriglutamate--homocysteine S-methyltransferase [Kocuria sp. TGY1127_2]|uniref:5-methyltetrahydropteroyltriglutamate-- homocysteine S-methyltransferase n=1 Tax=Kocuria sp. TGY1127_2 TaxID=2711328 RepID=UPI0015B94D01